VHSSCKMTSELLCTYNYNFTCCSAGNGQCLEDQPDASLTLSDPTDLPGFTFDANAQCRSRFGPTAEVCPFAIDVSYSYILKQ